MDLSVICPVYNNVETMLPMITSFQQQDIGNYEIEYIFVCNGCTDNSKEVIKGLTALYPKTFKNCKIFEPDFADVGLARNFGVEHSTGDYIFFCDMDDWFLSRTVFKELLNLTKIYPNTILHFKFDLPKKDWFFLRDDRVFFMTYWRMKYLSSCMVWQFLFPRKVFDLITFLPDKKGEDDLFFTDEMKQLLKQGVLKIKHLEDEYYFWDCMNPKSYSYKKNTQDKILTKREVIDYVNHLPEEAITPLMQDVVKHLL